MNTYNEIENTGPRPASRGIHSAKKKILFIFGTRPEAVKMAPVIKKMAEQKEFRGVVCVLRQHGKMLDQVLEVFDIHPDYDLKIRLNDKDLFSSHTSIFRRLYNLGLTGLSLLRLFILLKKEKPQLVVVHGDTSTAFLVAFIAFNFKMPIAHVEAGLRTYDKYNPFPEDANRRLIGVLADVHLAPTESAKKFLVDEHIKEERIFVTGNTEIDALFEMIKKQKAQNEIARLTALLHERHGLTLAHDKKLILVTAHRRESFGEGLAKICLALKDIAEKRSDVQIVYPVHLNPNVQRVAADILRGVPRILLTEPVDYELFIFLLAKSYLILTDSGGIQEIAPSLGKPLLVLRGVTERPEVVEAGIAKLVGTDRNTIVKETLALLDDPHLYAKMARVVHLYGDGKAAKRIIDALSQFLSK